MPAFKFSGITNGSTVALSVTQGSNTESGSTTNWGQGSMASVNISVNSSASVTAPAGIWFEATNISGFDVAEDLVSAKDPSFDDITYVWTIEGAPLADYSAPNILSQWNDANTAYGKQVCFFLTAPDTTYTVRLWAIDRSGNIATKTTSVTTNSADTVYPGAQTICLDPTGSHAGAPSGAQLVTSVAAMQAALNSATMPSRILIARGQSVDEFYVDGTGGNLEYVGAFGSGARPILNAADFSVNMFDFQNSSADYVTLDGLDCRGDWDAASETTSSGHLTNGPAEFGSSTIAHLSCWDCRFDGFRNFTAYLQDSIDCFWLMGNTEITNWRTYGMFVYEMPFARVGLTGCDFAHHPDAANHYQNSNNELHNTQGPIRIPQAEKVYIGASSFLSRAGWSSANDQECLRLNSGCHEGHFYSIERTVLEGGAANVKLSGSNSGNTEKPGNYVFDKVLFLAGGGKTGFTYGDMHMGGTTIRNCVGLTFDVPSANAVAFQTAFNLSPHQTDASNLATPVKIYNCTSLNLRSAANDLGDKPRIHNDSTPFLDVTVENNVVHGPSLDSPQIDDHPLDLATAMPGVSARYKGTRPNFDLETGTLGSTVPDGGQFSIPYPAGTDQAYWLGLPDDRHAIVVGSTGYYALKGQFSVSFGVSNVTLTNFSGADWTAGSNWLLRLDRKSLIPPANGTYANPPAIPLPNLDTGSAAENDGDFGLKAYDDFLGNVRPGPGGTDHLGNPRPATGNDRGAVLKLT